MNLLDYINDNTNNAYKDFKLVSVIFDENSYDCIFKFLYKNDIKDDDKEKLTNLIEKYFNEPDVKVIVKCKKAYVDESLVKDVVFNYISRHFASVVVGLDKNDIFVNLTDGINVSINCNEFQFNYLNSPNVYQDILLYCESFFFEEFNISFNNLKDQVESESPIENNLDGLFFNEEESKIKYNKVTDIENQIGEVVGSPIQIACIESAMSGIEIAGEIKFFTEKSFESKRKDKNGESLKRVYYSFTLFDKTGRFNCVIFPNKSDMVKAFNLKDGMTVIVHGDVEEFNGRMNFKCKSLALCKFVTETEQEVEVNIIKEPNDDFLVVKPEPYIEITQDNLFAVKEEVGEYLLKNDVVVFDIETTGLEATRCEVIEIGAVKIHNGKISETFETLIKPVSEIPDEIIDLTGITPDMVVNSPSFKQVIPDFYKFCYNTTIMAYNIDFDYKFISVHSKKYGYEFDMKQIDVMYLARAFIPGLKNFKLSTVCKKLDVSLENAHRAVHDAMATAEVVIKLSKNIT
jgi:DNA polymerase III epsilon subunit family exonuclease